jgi:UDP-N-acetylglucosamine diphosphorylase/glucosamine-1-phosphate N-acetyltransferase
MTRTTRILVLDDGRAQLSPLCDLRPSFDIRTGALTTLERIERTVGPVAGLIVPAPMEAITREMHPDRAVNADVPLSALVVNGRHALPTQVLLGLAPGAGLVDEEDSLVAAHLGESDVAELVANPSAVISFDSVRAPDALLTRPWHVRRFRDRALDADLASWPGPPSAPPPGTIAFGTHSLVIAPEARIYPGVVLDLESGPIVIDRGAVIRPACTIIGPAYIGRGSTVLDRAIVKAHSAIGPSCKVAGEVGGTIFQGFANKAHDGHLGDSWIGEWVNLGAGTTNSNLLNTYGEVIARSTPSAPNERTGEQFLGAIIGDHVKAAICTRIMTGAILHAGSMFARTAAVSGTIPGFTWSTDAGDKQFRFDKFLEVAEAAMARRKVTPSAAYIARLLALHAARG